MLTSDEMLEYMQLKDDTQTLLTAISCSATLRRDYMQTIKEILKNLNFCKQGLRFNYEDYVASDYSDEEMKKKVRWIMHYTRSRLNESVKILMVIGAIHVNPLLLDSEGNSRDNEQKRSVY